MFGKKKKEETFDVKNLYIVRPCEFKISEDKQRVICDNENVTIGYVVVEELVCMLEDVLTNERYVSIKDPCIAYSPEKYAVIDKIPLYTKLKDSKKTTITRSEIIDLLKLMNYQEYTDIIFR